MAPTVRVPEPTVAAFIGTLPGLDIVAAAGARFFFYDPRRDKPHDQRHPFATILTANDAFDTFSDLGRPGVFRVNAGVERETYRQLFGPEPGWNPKGPVATGHDFAQLDTFLPNPVYAPLSWICILSPTERTWPRLQAFLREAHAKAKRQDDRHLRDGPGGEKEDAP